MIEILRRYKLVGLLLILFECLGGIALYLLDTFVFDISLIVVIIVLSSCLFLNTVFLISSLLALTKKSKKNYLKIAKLIGNDTKQSYIFGQVGMIIYDENKEIIWTSDLLEERNINIVGNNLFEWKPELEEIFEDDSRVLNLNINGSVYKCLHLSEIKLIVIQDITSYYNLSISYRDEAPVLINLVIDNYSEVSNIMDENNILDMDVKVRKCVTEWAEKFNVSIKKIKTDMYMCFCLEKDYQRILADNFSVVDEVRNACAKEEAGDNGFTLSLGIARGERDYSVLSDMAANAIDVALSRGGDQIVVNSSGNNLEFYGGKTETKFKRNRIKVKVMAKSFKTLVNNSSNVIIMGHNNADMDAIGSALGIYAIVNALKKPVKIVYDENKTELRTRTAFKQMFDKADIEKMTISVAKAPALITPDTLLILTDVNKKEMTMAPAAVDKASKVAIIDHHRMVDKQEAAVFSYQESSASSASEIVSELIRYDDQRITITPEIATMMFAGILLDTNNFRVRTGVRTYDAAMFLKEFNADQNQAMDFLKDEYEEYVLKNRIMANTETPYYGVLVTTANPEDIVTRAMLATIADDALYIKGVRTIFVIGYISDTTVGISARSDGSNNVQMIMEKLGGGGHFSAAAAQKENMTIEEVKKELMNILDIYIGDSRLEQ